MDVFYLQICFHFINFGELEMKILPQENEETKVMENHHGL
jgi:hypothetical protein